MKEKLKIIKEKEKGFIILIMVINMKVIGRMINLKDMEFIIIIMSLIKVINMKVFGRIINLKEKEFIIIMKVILKIVIGKMM